MADPALTPAAPGHPSHPTKPNPTLQPQPRSFTSRRGVKSSANGHIRNDHLRGLVALNVKKTLDRVRGIAPRR
jgi:hypothetical protein